MALKYAPLCKQCHKAKTQHSSGLCSRCRRRPKPEVPCKLCGEKNTNHESGYCHLCRKRIPAPEHRLAAAIEDQKTVLLVLELRQKNVPFSEIASVIGMSKSAAYGMYRRALGFPELPVPIEVDI